MNIALLPGDGIGPKRLIAQAVKVVNAVEEKFGHPITFKEAITGAGKL